MEENKYTVYVHKVNTENGPMYYVGVTTNVKSRWHATAYRTSSLWCFIQNYGWDNIEHSVMFETDNRKKAYEVEDMLICGYRTLDRCINYQRSGLKWATDRKEYDRLRRLEKHDEIIEYDRKYNQEHREEQKAYAKQWYYANLEKRTEYQRQRGNTPEHKIYMRVYHFNKSHPDLAIESPLEAKMRFLETGYVPDYISHDSL